MSILGFLQHPRIINPLAVDRPRKQGYIQRPHQISLWSKRGVALALVSATTAALLVFFKVIPSDLSESYRIMILGVAGAMTGAYIATLSYRNIEARSIFKKSINKDLPLISLRHDCRLGFKYASGSDTRNQIADLPGKSDDESSD